MDKKVFKNAMKGAASLGVLMVLSQTLFPSKKMTNYAYLQDIIAHNILDETAEKLIEKFKSQNPGLDEQRLLQTKKIISECMKSQAQEYLISGAPYLQASANEETPIVLAARFMTACDLL